MLQYRNSTEKNTHPPTTYQYPKSPKKQPSIIQKYRKMQKDLDINVNKQTTSITIKTEAEGERVYLKGDLGEIQGHPTLRGSNPKEQQRENKVKGRL